MKKTPLFKNKRFLTSLFGIFIISIMLLSLLNVYQTKGDNKVEYDGHIFYNKGDYWISNINGKELSFRYNPREVEDIELVNFPINNKIYVAYNPQEFEQESFVLQESMTLFKSTNTRPVLACYEEEDCPNIPLINCSEDSSIMFKYNEKENIYIEDKCLVIEGSQEYQLRYVYKLIYWLLRI